MPRKPIEIPPQAARSFVDDMRAYFAAGHNSIKADAIAARQLHVLRGYQGSHERPIKLHQVKEMFVQMRSDLA